MNRTCAASRPRRSDEGLSGVSPRFVINAISNAITRSETKSLTSMEVLLALKDAIENDARMDASRKKEWVDFLVLARKDFYNRWVKEDVHRALFASFERGSAAASREVSRRGGGRAGQARRSTTRSRASLGRRTSVSCDPSRRRSRSPTPASSRSVRRSCAKRWSHYKAGEKFTLDSHARLHEGIEQYLFEERRDVLRLVTSAARPDEDAEEKISAVQERLDQRVRLRRAQRQGGAQLCHDAAIAGVRLRRMSDSRMSDDSSSFIEHADGEKRWYDSVLARRPRLAPAQRQSQRAGARKAAGAAFEDRRAGTRKSREHAARAGALSRALSLSAARRSVRSAASVRAKASRATRSRRPPPRGRRRPRPGRQQRRGLPVRARAQDPDDIVDWLWEELELPHLQNARRGGCGNPTTRAKGWNRRGVRSRLDRRRSVQRGHQAPGATAARAPRSRTRICAIASSSCASKPATEAVVFFAMDVSSSMTERRPAPRQDVLLLGRAGAAPAVHTRSSPYSSPTPSRPGSLPRTSSFR